MSLISPIFVVFHISPMNPMQFYFLYVLCRSIVLKQEGLLKRRNQAYRAQISLSVPFRAFLKKYNIHLQLSPPVNVTKCKICGNKTKSIKIDIHGQRLRCNIRDMGQKKDGINIGRNREFQKTENLRIPGRSNTSKFSN